MKSKKAQISIEFNWIFVLIAGALILLFFVGIVNKQKQSSNINLAGTVATKLEAILTGTRLSTGSTEPLDIPDVDIGFICDEDGVKEFTIDERVSRNLDSEVVFAPNEIKGPGELRAWSLDFSYPFKITNFLYLTYPKIRYVFVYSNNDLAEDLFSRMPAKSKEQTSNIGDIEDLNHEKVRFVFFDNTHPGTIPNKLQTMPDKDVSAVQINPPNELVFFEKQDSSFEQTGITSYLVDSKETLFGAIFSEDINSYKCNMNKVFDRFKIIAKVHAARELELIEKPRTGCNSYYSKYTENMLEDLEENCFEISPSCSNSLISDLGNLEYNNDLLKRQSCPLIY